MKKKLVMLALAVVLSMGTLTGCTASKNDSTANTNTATTNSTQTEAWEPTGTITMIAAAAAGSGFDTSARQFCKAFNETGIVTQTMKVENDAGGAGQVGSTNFLHNKNGSSDTLLVTSTATVAGAIANNWEATYENLTPICKLVVDSWTIVSKTGDDRYDTFEKLVEVLKTDPASVKIGAAAPPDADYIGLVLFCQQINVDPNEIQYVVYDGGGESIPALLGGDIDVCISTVGEFTTYVEAGQVTGLAVASEESLPSGVYSSVPTFKDLGYDFVYGNWRGIWGPSNMPPEAFEYWQNAAKALVESPEFDKICADMQWIKEPVIDGIDEWTANFAADVEGAMRESGIIQ